MNEDLLHFIWNYRLYDSSELQTTDGETVQVVHTGTLNTNAGADFQNAKIKIGETLWAGNVELHISSNDWFTHHHHKDVAYDNVVLHVAYRKDGKRATRTNGEAIATLELFDKINPALLHKYEALKQNRSWIPCEKFVGAADEFTVQQQLQRSGIERLESKVDFIEALLREGENDWENVLLQMLARYIGSSVNKEPMMLLMKSLSSKTIAKHSSDIGQIEALLFGCAGMLEEDFEEAYPTTLHKEWNYLKRLHNLTAQEKSAWKLLRLRPANFPTLRIAQLSSLLFHHSSLFSKMLTCENAAEVRKLLSAEASSYWQTHFQFEKISAKQHETGIGEMMKNILLINAAVPVLFAYGKYKDDEEICERAMNWLNETEAEANAIIKRWSELGVTATNAFESQAMLQLKNEQCDKFRCLQCGIGLQLLR